VAEGSASSGDAGERAGGETGSTDSGGEGTVHLETVDGAGRYSDCRVGESRLADCTVT